MEPIPEDRRSHTFRRRFLHMVGRDDPPEMVAASFALGVGIAFTPLFGVHWAIALFLAFLLRLNKIDVLLGTLVINPFTIPPTSWAAVHIGRFVLRARGEAMVHLPWNEILKRSFWMEAGPRMREVLLQWATGMLVLSILTGTLTYTVLVRVLRARRDRERTSFLGLE